MLTHETKPPTRVLSASSSTRWRKGLIERMQGPGGYYNVGNALGLSAGLVFQLLAAQSDDGASAVATLREYLVGSPGATALSIAMVMFFVSGELYHRAFASPNQVDEAMLRRADLLSGIAALVLAVALVLFGSLWLALASTVLLAGGKLGNAFAPRTGWPVHFPALPEGHRIDLLRLAPALSRIPAIASIVVEMARVSVANPPDLGLQMAQSTILLVCYLLWARADFLLLRR